jgi:hypothetical protein
LFRARLSGERWFAQALASDKVEASVQSTPVRFSLDVGGSVSRAQAWTVGLGGGADVVRVEPKRTLDATVTPAAARTHPVPVLRAEVRYELGAESWCLVLAAFADLSLLRSHYDLERGAALETVAAPALLRPGAALILAWRPGPR